MHNTSQIKNLNASYLKYRWDDVGRGNVGELNPCRDFAVFWPSLKKATGEPDDVACGGGL